MQRFEKASIVFMLSVGQEYGLAATLGHGRRSEGGSWPPDRFIEGLSSDHPLLPHRTTPFLQSTNVSLEQTISEPKFERWRFSNCFEAFFTGNVYLHPLARL